jgi:MoaA/NifB/PqqE/SkfB family radical SAM enzyme
MYVYMDELGPSVYIVQSEGEAEKLKKIWFTKQQYQRKQGRTMELAREWMNRVKRHQCQDIAGSADLRDPTLGIHIRGEVPYWGKIA